MRLTDLVNDKVEAAIAKLTWGELNRPPDHECFIMDIPPRGLRAMVVLIVPLSSEDNTAPRDDIDPYDGQDEFDQLLARLWKNAMEQRHGIIRSAAPGLIRRSASGLHLPG